MGRWGEKRKKARKKRKKKWKTLQIEKKSIIVYSNLQKQESKFCSGNNVMWSSAFMGREVSGERGGKQDLHHEASLTVHAKELEF